jgi:hypothetical protein
MQGVFAGHVTGVPIQAPPALQVSPYVDRLRSSQLAPAAFCVAVQVGDPLAVYVMQGVSCGQTT